MPARPSRHGQPSPVEGAAHSTARRMASRPETLGPRSPNAGAPRISGNQTRPSEKVAREERSAPAAVTIILIDRRVLIRECLVWCLKRANENCVIRDFASVSDWQEATTDDPPTVIILCTQDGDDHECENDLTHLSQEGMNVPVIVVSDAESADQILSALESGARGYIPTSMSLDVAVKAMRLVEAGGTFVPASSIISSRRRESGGTTELSAAQAGRFTERQAAVLAALRQGKANKQIAYELNMREGTVKVHVRNIMKKLKARNRTEVAFLTNVRPDRDH